MPTEYRVGELLKKKREEKNKSIKEVSKETSIMTKYIIALEEENWDRFPSETYLIGFLTKYGTYLGVDAEELINMYKAQKKEETQPPFRELVDTSLQTDYSLIIKKVLLIFISIGIFLGGSIYIYSYIQKYIKSQKETEKLATIKEVKEAYNKVSSSKKAIHTIQKTENMNKKSLSEPSKLLVIKGDEGEIIAYKNDNIGFNIEGEQFILHIKDIVNQNNKYLIYAIFYPDNKEITMKVLEPTYLISPSLPREVAVIVKGANENAIRLYIKLLGRLKAYKQLSKKGKGKRKIVAEFEGISNSFVEMYVDGNLVYSGILHKGDKKTWIGFKNLQFRIGNAGGVNIKINGKEYNFGEEGIAINKKVFWAPSDKNPENLNLTIADW